jgi:hypothetical protein
LSRATYNICGHNILGHDLPLLERLYGWRPTPGCTIEDTLVLSRMLLPNILELDNQAAAMGDPAMGRYHGKHSIAAWGLRLRKCKAHGDITDWSRWTPEMHERCIVDVQITTQLWQFQRSDAYSREARELEHRIAPLCARIQEDGVPINAAKARKLHDELIARKTALGAQLTRQFGSWLAPIHPVELQKPFTPARDDRAKACRRSVDPMQARCLQSEFETAHRKSVYCGPVLRHPAELCQPSTSVAEYGWVASPGNRDRGASHDAAPPTPPGIRVRTTAVRRIKRSTASPWQAGPDV